MAYFPKVDPVKIDPIDLGEIRKENTLAALGNQRLQEMAYESGSRNALNDVLKVNPNATGQNVIADMAARGFGEAGQKYAYNWMNRQHADLQYETDLRKEVSNIIGSVTDEDSKNRAIDYLQQAFPHASAQFEQFRSVPWETARSQGNTFALGAAGRVAKDRQDAALESQGYAPGQDPNTLSTISSMHNAADANQRGWNADRRSAEENERAKEIQPYRIENLQSETDARRNKQQIVYGPDPSDFRGKRKIPGIVVPGENGGPGTFVPLQGVQGQQPFGSEGDMQGSPVPQGGQPQGQASQRSPVPGARQAPDGNWYVPDPNRPGKYLRVN